MVAYIVLGVVQGITEFLPVSSHGHLKVFQKLLGVSSMDVALDVTLHLGTLLAVGIYFFPDIRKALRDARMWGLIGLVTVITGVIGVGGKKFFLSIYDSAWWLAAGWAVSGIVLLLTRGYMAGTREKLTRTDAAVMGVAQGLAVVPSISRSGFTIASLLFRGAERKAAFAFSFIASIPAILGAALLDAKDIGAAISASPWQLAAGFVASFFSGWCALILLKRIMQRKVFYLFGYYCLAAAAATLLFVR
jgi:undecaprenyl-diphosphatase